LEEEESKEKGKQMDMVNSLNNNKDGEEEDEEGGYITERLKLKYFCKTNCYNLIVIDAFFVCRRERCDISHGLFSGCFMGFINIYCSDLLFSGKGRQRALK